MRTGSGRCLIFAMQMALDYLARLTRAARRVQVVRRRCAVGRLAMRDLETRSTT